MRRNAVARDDFGEGRLLVGGAHDGDQPSGRRADAHDVEFGQLRLGAGSTRTRQRNTPYDQSAATNSADSASLVSNE